MGFRGIVRKDRGNDDLGRGLCNEWKREREREMRNGQMGYRCLPFQQKIFRLLVE